MARSRVNLTEIPNVCNGEVLGEQFAKLLPLISDYIASSPATARLKLAEGRGLPDQSGRSNRLIAAVRSAVADLVPTHLRCAFAIVAPHSHWDEHLPLVYSFDACVDAYRLTPLVPLGGQCYRAVSFAFGLEQPLAYEWADQTIAMQDDDYHAALQSVRLVHRAIDCAPGAIGLSLNFRFRSLSSHLLPATVEVPGEQDGRTYGEIRLATHALDAPDAVFEQVAWMPNLDGVTFSSAAAEVTAIKIESLLGSLSLPQRFAAIQALRSRRSVD